MKRRRDFEQLKSLALDRPSEQPSDYKPKSLTRSVSPPAISHSKPSQLAATTAQVEAGEENVDDHLSFFSSKLHLTSRVTPPETPRLDHHSWINLYTRNANNSRGHHFVIHQHDHPISGTHYDLRLQCNETSSVSWAIMYGLPGDPNSRRLNRNATETRIHCLWNHLIETASHQTGTLLIWDTGYYEVLPYYKHSNRPVDQTTDEDESESDENATTDPRWSSLSEPEKLHTSFQNRKVRLRLHGTRLPKRYTISLRLSKDNDRAKQPAAPKRRRRRNGPDSMTSTTSKFNELDSDANRHSDDQSSSDRDTFTSRSPRLGRKLSSLHRHESPPLRPPPQNLPTSFSTSTTPLTVINTQLHSPTVDNDSNAQALSNRANGPSISSSIRPTEVDSQELIRLNNAYPGALNSINSVHQRKWYLSLDSRSSGFTRSSELLSGYSRKGWTLRQPRRDESPGRSPYPFHVLGPAHERSVVTGRLARDILADEGVVGYVPRGQWRAIVE